MKAKKYFLLNFSNVVNGGALQVATSFLSYLTKKLDYKFTILVTREFIEVIENIAIPKHIELIQTPKSSIRKIYFINKFTRSRSFDAVFSLFGPSMILTKKPYLMGFALPWLIYSPYGLRRVVGNKTYFKKKN